MFATGETKRIPSSEHFCLSCHAEETPITGALASCGCCDTPVKVCGACCLLRHTEQRYEIHDPDEESESLEYVARLQDDKREALASESLVLVSPFDGIGGSRRALEIPRIKPALYVSIETDPNCHCIVKNAWPEVVIFD